MDRQAREARAARLAAVATTSQNRQQDSEDSASTPPDADVPMSILPAHEDEAAKDLAEQSPSPETPAGADNNTPTSTSQPDTPSQVSVRLA